MVVKAGHLLTEAGLADNGILRIENGRIAELLRSPSTVPGTVCDFSDYTVIPCFCDHHLHFSARSCSAGTFAEQLLQHGITSVWDGGSPDGRGVRLRTSSSGVFGIRTAGSALYKTGTYGSPIGVAVADLQEAMTRIDELAAAQADYVKIINSGVFIPETGEISPGGFPLPELEAIVQYAEEKGLETFCHANGRSAISDAVAAGAAGIVHGLSLDDETLSRMAEQKTAFIPTIAAFRRLEIPCPSGQAAETIARAVEIQCSTAYKAVKRGVSVLAGSDAGASFIPYGTAFHEELTYFLQAGLSPEEVYRTAITGTFEKDRNADFLVVDGLEVKAVYIGGRLVAENW
jgi:imidazolonepropionase-like amidohydrolase